MQDRLWMMMLFFNIPEKGCILRRKFPCWHLTWVPLGTPNRLFPDSGVSLACAGVVRIGAGPCSFKEFCPLQTTSRFRLRTMAHVVLGLAAALAISSQVNAQQYVYYPTRGASQPTYYVQPTYTYQAAQGYPTQYTQPSYAPQYYQYTYAPQYYQPANTGQVAQATYAPQTTADGTQVVPASYTVPVAEPAAAQPQPAQAAPAAAYGRRPLRVPELAELDPGVLWTGSGRLRPEPDELGLDEQQPADGEGARPLRHGARSSAELGHGCRVPWSDVDGLARSPRRLARSHHQLDRDRRGRCVLDLQRLLSGRLVVHWLNRGPVRERR